MAEQGEKIYVSSLEEIEKLLDDGTASIDDYEDFVDWYFGYSKNYSDENGFYIYPNVGLVASAGSEIDRLVGLSLTRALLESDFEEFHYCDQHDCATHGNWAEAEGSGDTGPAGPFFTGYKGRSVSKGQKVKVYRNLHKSGVVYSIRDAKTGQVLGHSPSVMLENVEYEVHEAGRQRVIKEKKKNVHSFVTGTYAGPYSAAERKEAVKGEAVSYNPYKSGSYYSKVDERPVAGADSVIVDQTGVYMTGERKKELRASADLDGISSEFVESGSVSGKLTWRERWLHEFHRCDEHDCKTHGNWAKGGVIGDEPSDLALGEFDKPVVIGDRLGTARPTGKKTGGLEASRSARMGSDLISDEQLADKKTGPGLISRVTSIPGFEDLADLKGDEFKEAVIERMSQNIEHIADLVMGSGPGGLAEAQATADWYPYANGFIRKLAAENGIDAKGAIAATAALSASAAWTSNVPWAKYLMEEMATNKGPGKGINQVVDPRWAVAQYMADLQASQSPSSKLHGKVHAEDYAALIGKPLSALNDRQVAMMLRGKHDAAGTYIPETGKFSKGLVRELGEEVHAGFGTKGAGTIPQSVDNLEKAISVLRDSSDAKIDVAIGQQNKVRSFYQNLRDPENTEGFDDVTVDTHHYGIAAGMPFTVNTRFVASGTSNITGTPSNATTGALGAYALVVDATRRATERINAKYKTAYKPNQVQSIVWEGWKDYFPPHIRSRQRMIDSIESARTAHALYLRTGGKEGISENEMRARVDAARTTEGGPTVEELSKLYASRG